MKYYILLIFVLFYFTNTYTQTITIIDKSDLKPISNASIYNSSKTKMVITDLKGKAEISDFNEQDTLHIKHIAYQELKIEKAKLPSNLVVKLYDNIIKLDEVVFSANKYEEKRTDLPNKIEIINVKLIEFNNPQTSGDLLQNSGDVFVQQSQMGGGSPVLRGFEANKVLLVIDGVRMNNAIYRGGHLQNVITIDPNAIERTEVVFGPGSVIYGSDALGGVMHFYTKNPMLSTDDKTLIKASAFSRYSSANNEMAGGLSLNIGFKKFASYTNFSYKKLDDLRQGYERNPFYGDWGKCIYYPSTIDGKDTTLTNSDNLIQKGTGYSQYDLLQKFLFHINDNLRITANFQLSNSSDIPRYDRLQQFDSSTGLPKFSEWYYGPQTRILSYIKVDLLKQTILYDRAKFVAAYQNISEDRITRRFNKTSKTFQEETVNIFSLNSDFEKHLFEENEIRYGIEISQNYLNSIAYNKNIITNEAFYNSATRYPDEKGLMRNMAAYITHNWEISENFIFSKGIRLSNINLLAQYSDTMMKIMKFPFNPIIKQNSNALNGNIGLVFTPGYDWRFSIIGSTGFRAPNIDDLGKVNDSKGKDRLLIVPNPDLKPEYAYNGEFSIDKTFNKTVQVEATTFYTLLKDAIVARPYSFNGQDSIVYDGYLSEVQANTNAGEAYIYGLQGSINAQITPSFSILSKLSYTYGRLIENDVPLDHIPPIYGLTSAKLEINKFKGEFFVKYNGWKKLKDYSPSGEDNLQNATQYGNPAWFTLNFRSGIQLNTYAKLSFAIENILDTHYRLFASGVSAPGRNFIISLRGEF